MAQCAICLEDLSKGNVHKLPCSSEHVFHTECIMQHFRRGDPRCPLCRDVPDACKTLDADEELAMMESLTRLHWKKYAEKRNRWARKDEEIRAVRSQYWDARDTVRRLGKNYNTHYNKEIRASLRGVNRKFQADRRRLHREIAKMYEMEEQFNDIVRRKSAK